jgi:hypothetical protein
MGNGKNLYVRRLVSLSSGAGREADSWTWQERAGSWTWQEPAGSWTWWKATGSWTWRKATGSWTWRKPSGIWLWWSSKSICTSDVSDFKDEGDEGNRRTITHGCLVDPPHQRRSDAGGRRYKGPRDGDGTRVEHMGTLVEEAVESDSDSNLIGTEPQLLVALVEPIAVQEVAD